MGSYFYKPLHNELIFHESSLPLQFNKPFKELCVYHQVDFENKLTDKQSKDTTEKSSQHDNLVHLTVFTTQLISNQTI